MELTQLRHMQGQVGAPLPNLTVATDEATKGEMKRRVLYLSAPQPRVTLI